MGKYSFGDHITMADVFLYPQIEGAIQKYQIELSCYPNILQVYKNLKDHELFEKSLAKYCSDYDE